MLFQILLGLICCALSHGAAIEPLNEGDCSRFVYEYKIMERLVKLELDKTAMYNRITDLEEKCSTITKTTVTQTPPLIAVKVGISASKNARNGDRIIYDRVIANEGDAYDTLTGIFEAPIIGVYSFTVSVCLGSSSKYMVMAVVRNRSDLVIGQLISGDRAFHTCTNDYTTVKLDRGDRVWVEKLRGNADELNEDHGWNSFSANLIQPA